MPDTAHPSYVEIGAAVFAALTDAELADLADGIRNARISFEDEEDQADGWLCLMMQNEVAPQGLTKRIRRVTRADLLLTCVDLAQLQGTRDWQWILGVWQVTEHRRRAEYLFTAAAQSMIPARPALVREAARLKAKEH